MKNATRNTYIFYIRYIIFFINCIQQTLQMLANMIDLLKNYHENMRTFHQMHIVRMKYLLFIWKTNLIDHFRLHCDSFHQKINF